MKLKIEIDLMKIRQASFENGNIVIPVDNNEIKMFKSQRDGSLKALASFFALERKSVGAHKETHVIKQSLTTLERNNIIAGVEVNNPIVGNIMDLDLQGNDENNQ